MRTGRLLLSASVATPTPGTGWSAEQESEIAKIQKTESVERIEAVRRMRSREIARERREFVFGKSDGRSEQESASGKRTSHRGLK